MRSVSKSDLENLCRGVVADRYAIWRSATDMNKEDALLWAVFSRLCGHLEIEPLVVPTGAEDRAAVYRYNIMRVLEDRKADSFDTLATVGEYIQPAIDETEQTNYP